MEIKPSLTMLFLWKSIFSALNNRHEHELLEIRLFINQELFASHVVPQYIKYYEKQIYLIPHKVYALKQSLPPFTNDIVWRLSWPGQVPRALPDSHWLQAQTFKPIQTQQSGMRSKAQETGNSPTTPVLKPGGTYISLRSFYNPQFWETHIPNTSIHFDQCGYWNSFKGSTGDTQIQPASEAV